MSGLLLSTEELLSKWGFNDGDEPDALLDWLDDNTDFDYRGIDWHTALRGYVRTMLLPLSPHSIEVYDIETIHNPIRAASVDGQPVPDEVIYGNAEFAMHHVGIEIPWQVIYEDLRRT